MAVKNRVEIIVNQAVEEDLFDRMRIHEVTSSFTRWAPVFGKGHSGERRGDHVWPEENIVLTIYCNDNERDRLMQSVREVKQLFPNEGIKLYSFQVDVLEI
ncbi:MAG: PG0541 family transporter-associated protein [Spirochaeta sp.]